MNEIRKRCIAAVGLVLLLITVAACNSLIDANLAVTPFAGGDPETRVLYLGINDATKCGGCSDNEGSWTVTIETGSNPQVYSMQVDSTVSAWQSTGVIVAEDDTLSIHAGGQICYVIGNDGSPGSFCGPDGIAENTSTICYLAPGLPRNSLVARIGTGDPFFVGAVYGSTTAGGEQNYVPPDLSKDYFPLSSGSQWFLRDAKGDWLPTHHASTTILQDIEGTAVIDGVSCYVLKTQMGDKPATYMYLHRTKDAVYEYASGTDTSMTTYSAPIFRYKLPFTQGTSWTYQAGDETVKAKVLFQEMIAISPTGDYPAQMYQSCWKLQIDGNGATDYEWYAPGVGRVKYVTNSINYELVSHKIGGV